VVLDCARSVSIRFTIEDCRCARGLNAPRGAPRQVQCNVRFERKNSPEMLRASQRTTTTFWPLRSCLATMEARRPRRWPLPSTTTCRTFALAQCSVAFLRCGFDPLPSPSSPRATVHLTIRGDMHGQARRGSQCRMQHPMRRAYSPLSREPFEIRRSGFVRALKEATTKCSDYSQLARRKTSQPVSFRCGMKRRKKECPSRPTLNKSKLPSRKRESDFLVYAVG
jgi:hypothetical protein